ncbi:MAG: DUF4339 domain-containing protein [Blastochloris sp.]|nr:DUF4339 domain-containing protein [Blastochloris sp.]
MEHPPSGCCGGWASGWGWRDCGLVSGWEIGSNSGMSYYVHVQEQTLGPFTLEEIREGVKTGQFQAEMPCAEAGAAAWRTVAEVVGGAATLLRWVGESPGWIRVICILHSERSPFFCVGRCFLCWVVVSTFSILRERC